jgi:DNA-binding transcriptional regulator LsrR (DeoR family)
MVQAGKTVVLMAGGERGAKAISALYRAQRAGGSLFNTLVTDEEGARALLRQMGDEPDRSDEPNGWQRERLRFWAAHFYFASSPHHLSRQQLAQRLSVSRERASELLDEAIYGRDAKASLVRLQVVAPLPEPMPMLELEMALLQKFALREARVVEAGRAEWAYPAVGMAAAQLLLDWLQ